MPDKLVSMKLSKAERKIEEGARPVAMGERDEFPFGLTLHLEDETLKKLGVTGLPKVGSTDTLTAKFKVTSVSENTSEGSEERRSVSLQITDLQVGSGKGSALYSDGG